MSMGGGMEGLAAVTFGSTLWGDLSAEAEAGLPSSSTTISKLPTITPGITAGDDPDRFTNMTVPTPIAHIIPAVIHRFRLYPRERSGASCEPCDGPTCSRSDSLACALKSSDDDDRDFVWSSSDPYVRDAPRFSMPSTPGQTGCSPAVKIPLYQGV